MQRGQMIPKGDGKWLLRVFLGSEMIDGKRRRKYASHKFDGTTSQARQALTKMVRELDTDTFVAPSKTTVKDYITTWLDSKGNVSEKTLADYRSLMDLNVFPHVGLLKLSDVSTTHVRMLYTKLREDGRELSPRTIRYTHSVLSQALTLAVEEGKLQRNPCTTKAVLEALPKAETQNVVVLTAEQITRMLAKTTDPMHHALWRVGFMVGLRPQEMMALTWSDLETKEGLTWLTVRRAMHRGSKGTWKVSNELKTQGSKRSLVLDQDTVDALQRHRSIQSQHILKQGQKYNRQDIIFASEKGTHLDIANVRRWWKADLAAAGLPEVTLYVGTRHTHLSHYLNESGNAKATSERGGHSDPAMTLRRYIHTLPGTHEAAVLAFSQRLRQKA